MSFKEIIGQETSIAFLKSVYRGRRLAHAYVFVGSQGVGKTKTALNFAKLLVCEKPQQDDPCDRCPSCVKAEAMNHPDVQWVKPEGQFIKIDSIREACRRLNLKGFESSKKILIISEAEYLNDESSNALLKTLEEPTPQTVIILIATTLKAILPTIASRCQKIVFSSLSEENLVSLLKNRFGIHADAGVYLARLSEGSLGIALQYAQEGLFNRKNQIINEALDQHYSLNQFMGLIGPEREEQNVKIQEMFCVLLTWFRDLLLAKISGDPAYFINIDRMDEIKQRSRDFSFSEIEERMTAIADAGSAMERNINRRIALASLRGVLWKSSSR